MHFLSKEIADRTYEFYLSHKLLVCFLRSENRILFQYKMPFLEISLPFMRFFFKYLAQWIQHHFETTNSNFPTFKLIRLFLTKNTQSILVKLVVLNCSIKFRYSEKATKSELWIHSFGIGFWIRWARQWSD